MGRRCVHSAIISVIREKIVIDEKHAVHCRQISHTENPCWRLSQKLVCNIDYVVGINYINSLILIFMLINLLITAHPVDYIIFIIVLVKLWREFGTYLNQAVVMFHLTTIFYLKVDTFYYGNFCNTNEFFTDVPR